MRSFALIAGFLFAGAAGDVAGMPCKAESGPRLTPLVELYTSEGCNSCPPADRWLSTHFRPGTANGAVALAFHVDYWDRLGWKDRFASPAYTERQYATMRANRATFVYTPQVVLQGRDFTGWRRGSPEHALATASTRLPRAGIRVVASEEGGALAVEARVEILGQAQKPAVIALAYVESALRSEVKAGENRGETLLHDHVVRAFETHPLADASTLVKLRLPRPSEAGANPTLVAFVQETGSGEVLQTLALTLDGCR